MKLIKRDYDGHAVTYQDDGWFNATEASAKFGKRPVDWFENKDTKEYVAAVSEILNVPSSALIRTKRGAAGGTWLHPRLGVVFARWLDVKFAAWCDEQIDNLLRGKDDWRKLRHRSASSFKVANDILKLVRDTDGKETEPHHYSNEVRLINWALTGEFKSVDRDALPSGDLDLLAHLQERNAVLIGRGMNYEQRKPMIQQYAFDWRMDKAAVPPQPTIGKAA